MNREATEVIEKERKVIAALSDELGRMLIAHYCHLDEDMDLSEDEEIALAKSRAALVLAQMLKQMSQTKCGVVLLMIEDEDGDEHAVAHRFGYDPQGAPYARLFREIGTLSHHLMLVDMEAEERLRLEEEGENENQCPTVVFGKDDRKA